MNFCINRSFLKLGLRLMPFWLIVCLMGSQQAMAAILALPSKGDIVGRVSQVHAREGETLAEVGRRYSIGYVEILRANPKLDPSKPLHSSTKVLIPGQFILPAVPRRGIIINLAELRLYFFPKGQNVVITEPVGIGREGGWQTPIGKTTVTVKQTNPKWRPTFNVRAEAAKQGTPIPYEFPPGPDNPLGKHVLRLGWPTYLIHGTNRPEGVGARVSAGCIRMFPEGVALLYDEVKVGTEVRVINQPFKLGRRDGKLYFEAHAPLSEQQDNYSQSHSELVQKILNQAKQQFGQIHWTDVQKAIQQSNGIPQQIAER